ncbi:RNA 2',3'-cyclic phosphodiesterase [Trinickia symbiotica]|uniref:RNA 2',3'-cyclic phosphodiesterase n=1 Tax=Trinickia symbiotica TaxID=863227 RepID=A0A2T3XP92_9BURK|nr:RNA 2',3'-cyclic phosphodiesterase [Trinickia symbiotica]
MSPAAPVAERDDWHRCFIALVPDASTRETFASMPLDVAVRRVPVDQLHLTLAFLGSVSPEKGALLAAALPSVIVPLPALDGERFEYWPNRSHPRLVVVSFALSDALAEIESRVRTLVAGLGLPIDDHRPFLPHVTLARLPRNAKPIAAPVARSDGTADRRGETAAETGSVSRFDTLTLYSSTLERRGARYRALASACVPAD